MGTSEEIRREIPKFELPEVSFTPTRMPAPPQVVNEPKMFVTRPKIAEDTTETINEADKIKQMLKTGAIGNDPRKIKEMMMKLKESKTEKVQTKPEANPTLKTWKPEPLPVLKTWKPSPYQPKNEINFDDDDEDYDEDYDDEIDSSALSPLGIDPPETRKRIQSSSSYFRKFAQDNIGRNFRRPEPKYEAAKKATEIFRKYSSSSSYSNEEEDKENEEISSNTPAKFVPSPKEAPTRTSSSSSSSFSDLYKKKYGSRKSMKPTTDSSTNSQTFTEKVTYPPRPSSPRSKYNNKRFM